jgi:uncharacterized membrane protein (DUF4010 family)
VLPHRSHPTNLFLHINSRLNMSESISMVMFMSAILFFGYLALPIYCKYIHDHHILQLDS